MELAAQEYVLSEIRHLCTLTTMPTILYLLASVSSPAYMVTSPGTRPPQLDALTLISYSLTALVYFILL